MNEPNETERRQASDIYSDSESIRPTGEKIPVAHDETTVKDDALDYVFLKPKRSHHHSQEEKPANVTVASDELVRSTRNPSRRHHHRHHHSHKKKKRVTWKKVVLSVICVLLGIIALTVAVVGILMGKGSQELFDDQIKIITPDSVTAEVQDDGKYIVYKGQNYRYNEKVTSLMFMGVDKRDMQELETAGLGGQSDVNVLMAMDFKNRRTTMFAIPRDTMTDVALYSVGGTYAGMERLQLCLAYAYGDGKTKSCENTVASVRRIFYNIPVNSYFALDMDGIGAMNDAVGGVDVVSPETIGEFVEGESYHLVGKQAESFVRSRNHDSYDANIRRMQRQEVYAKAYMNKVISRTKKDITTPVTLFNESAPYSCTNLNPAKISVLAGEVVLGKGMSFETEMVKGASSALDETHAQFIIDEEAFFEQFLGAYYEKVDSIEQITGQSK